MSKMTTEQRQTIYGMATQLGIYEKGNPNDDLHALVDSLTGKSSIGDLTVSDAARVISELIRLKDGQNMPRKSKKATEVNRPGMITPDQIRKVWFFMYRLAEFDREPSKVSLAYRLCKIIEKELKITAFEKDPFRFISFEQGSTLIEVVKKYVQYVKRKSESTKSSKGQKLLEEASELQEKMQGADAAEWAELHERLNQVEREMDVLRIHRG